MLSDDAIMIAHGAGKALDRAEDSLRKWMEACNERDQAIERQNNSIRQLMAEVQQLKGSLKEKDAAFQEAQVTIEDKTMHIAGLVAQRTAYMEQHLDSPLLQDSGKRFKDGDVKTNVRLIYEAAHDAKGRELGITTPAERRMD